jgi:hypothetical protein
LDAIVEMDQVLKNAKTAETKWVYKYSEQTIQQPYYRIVCPATWGNNNGNPLGPGSYWTPRWNAIQSMLQSVAHFWVEAGRVVDKHSINDPTHKEWGLLNQEREHQGD